MRREGFRQVYDEGAAQSGELDIKKKDAEKFKILWNWKKKHLDFMRTEIAPRGVERERRRVGEREGKWNETCQFLSHRPINQIFSSAVVISGPLRAKEKKKK